MTTNTRILIRYTGDINNIFYNRVGSLAAVFNKASDIFKKHDVQITSTPDIANQQVKATVPRKNMDALSRDLKPHKFVIRYDRSKP